MSPVRVSPLDHEQAPRHTKFLRPTRVISILLGAALVALNITILTRINKQWNDADRESRATLLKGKAMAQTGSGLNLESSIRIEEVMSHMNELQRIGSASNGTRDSGTVGFNQSIDFIARYLTENTNYKVTKTFFNVVSDQLARHPVFTSSINGAIVRHTFAEEDQNPDFHYVEYTASIESSDFLGLSVISNFGCSESDWQQARPSPADRVALLKRGDCPSIQKAALAVKYRVRALLIFNDGTSPDRMSPIFVTLGQNNTLPALFLSFSLGQRLVDSVRDSSTIVKVRMDIKRLHESAFSSSNVCADTPTGDPTQTIIIGSHIDSVRAGPGINDNGKLCLFLAVSSPSNSSLSLFSLVGSGSAANLGLAVTLARLFRTSTYPKYKYRVRFCWWGAEEIGLFGSEDYVNKAKVATTVGDRLQDYLINLNYDMLASSNYIFGIYDGQTASNITPARALPGSNKITTLFRDWFLRNKLPWDPADFDGLSDHIPFLAEGIVIGGLFSGADDIKTKRQRDRYDAALGQGLGGISDIAQDPCYHKACDSIHNVNVFAFEKMVQAAAYVLESLGQQNDLKAWLYPAATTHPEIQNKNTSTIRSV